MTDDHTQRPNLDSFSGSKNSERRGGGGEGAGRGGGVLLSHYAVPHCDTGRGLVVKASASTAEDAGSNPACAGIFPGSSHTSDFRIGTSLATLPGAWRHRVSAGTGWTGVSIL